MPDSGAKPLPADIPLDSELELDEALSHPSDVLIETLAKLSGDILILGAGGKMGPTLVRMVRRSIDSRRVIAVSRFSDSNAKSEMESHGIETVSCDLLNRDSVARLPDAANVIFMAGRKFGTTDSP